MLSNKNRMAAKRRLLAIIGYFRWRQTLFDKIPRMIKNRCQAFLTKIIELFTVQLKAAAKC